MKGNQATKDLVVIGALLVLAFAVASVLDVFEWLFEVSRDHESWQLDELFTLIMFSSLALAVFAWRRWRESVRDNDRRRRAEEALRESEERYRAVISQSAENIFLADAASKRVLEANVAFRRLTGYTPEELQNMTIYDLVTHGPEEVDSHCRRALEFGQHFVGEHRYRTKEGSLVDVEASVSVASYGGEETFCVVARDITGRKRDEEALRRRDAILQAARYAADLFLKTPSWDSGMQSVLEALGEAAQASRAYVFENYPDGEGRYCGRQRYEWVPPGVPPQIDNPGLQALCLHEAGLGRWAEVLGREQTLYGNVRDFPEHERHDLVAQEIKSIVVVPVFVEGRWWGLIGFDETLAEREWSESEVNALRSAASTLGTAIRRERAEEELRRSEERFRSLVQNASDAITVLEPDGTVRYQSPAAERVLGFSPEKMVGKSGFVHVHPEDLGRLRAIFETNLKDRRSGVQPPVEVRVRHADGSWHHVEAVANYLLDDPNIRGIVVNARDITERREAEERLRRSEERFRNLFENAADAVFVHDLEGNFVDVNGRACESLGYTREELLGMSVPDVEVNFDPGVLEDLWDQMASGAPVTLDGRHRRKDGGVFPVEVRLGLFEQGGERLLIALARDVTERLEAEDTLAGLFPQEKPRDRDRSGPHRERNLRQPRGGGAVPWPPLRRAPASFDAEFRGPRRFSAKRREGGLQPGR